MNLTDQQWRLLETLLNDDTSQPSRGRPPHNPRPILDGILWKIRHAAAWENLPSCYPSHMTCYRRYRIWSHDGRLDQSFLSLYKDLLHRGRFDLQHALHDGRITVIFRQGCYKVLVTADLLDTWQLSTALVFIQIALSRLKQANTRTLTAKYSTPITRTR